VLVPDLLTAIRNAPALGLLRLGGAHVVLRLATAPPREAAYTPFWRYVIGPAVDEISCNSQYTAAELAVHGPIARKSRVIYNTVPTRTLARTSVARDDRRVIYVGQLIPEKGVAELLEAVALLGARGVDLRLDVVGALAGWEPPAFAGFRERLVARSRQPDLADRVRMLGWREDVPALLESACVHCCPSALALREGFGLVVIEAKQAGIPSVVTRSGALPELVEHRVDGWICEADTAESIAEGLAFFLGDRSRREAAGRAARTSLDRFSRQRFADAWSRVLGLS
jgi:glycosyltransferase involved in cell wall biosynthesis